MADEDTKPGKAMTDAERGEMRLKTRELARMLFRSSPQFNKGEGGGDRAAMVAARKEAWNKDRKALQMTARRLLRLMERNERVELTFKFSEEDLANAAKGGDDDGGED
ncbi:hypothetical protein [Mesobacterium pallidum]|uniref:hypothetical protein n=1 Tax=Mesobacterium pallidum TaxID=2872037 RepID=UPI001EE28036|nr:hypothetical protein [Mesobacterium pallidum]